MKRFDLIVIGSGLAGLMAARTAVERGARVLVVGRGLGGLTLFGNTIDVLGRLQGETDVAAGVESLVRNCPGHPYARMGWEGIERALQSFQSLFPPPYDFVGKRRENSLLPTGAGTMRPAFLFPVTMAAGAEMIPAATLIVGFRGFKDFQADTASLHLRCRGAVIPFPRYGMGGMTTSAVARMMEDRSFAERVGEAIQQQMAGERFVGLPAVLGLRESASVMKVLEAATGARVFEISMLPPSLPGTRIFERFREYLLQRGVVFLLGKQAAEAIVKDGRCERIVVPNAPLAAEYCADRFILATGRFLGGGLLAKIDSIVEPLFHTPVFQPARRGEWFKGRFFDREAHPVHQAGIETDAALRPLSENGAVFLENLWAAGSILAHHQAIEEKSREGIDIATGFMAAEKALSA
ncbi:MAG: anaerobic glycerol-3-phosphate dehydrogenase subunit B [Syntrophales bacterium]